MPYSRALANLALSEGQRLTADMAGIGMLFAVEPSVEPNIEDTLIAASVLPRSGVLGRDRGVAGERSPAGATRVAP